MKFEILLKSISGHCDMNIIVSPPIWDFAIVSSHFSVFKIVHTLSEDVGAFVLELDFPFWFWVISWAEEPVKNWVRIALWSQKNGCARLLFSISWASKVGAQLRALRIRCRRTCWFTLFLNGLGVATPKERNTIVFENVLTDLIDMFVLYSCLD